MFMGVFFRWSSLRPAEPPVYPQTQVPEGLRTGDYIERWRECPTLIKVTHPQLGPSKLPFDVSVVLRHSNKIINPGDFKSVRTTDIVYNKTNEYLYYTVYYI